MRECMEASVRWFYLNDMCMMYDCSMYGVHAPIFTFDFLSLLNFVLFASCCRNSSSSKWKIQFFRFLLKRSARKERITVIHIVTLVLAVYVFVALYYYFFSFFSFALYYGISFQWQRQEWNDQELNRRYFESSCDYNEMKREQEGERVKFPLICLSID